MCEDDVSACEDGADVDDGFPTCDVASWVDDSGPCEECVFEADCVPWEIDCVDECAVTCEVTEVDG